jgi:formamidopyrimidine-DNA glycosylase
MTGTLRTEAAVFQPARHDHLVLYQARRALVFNDPRQFGRVLFHQGKRKPEWWSSLPPALDSPAFTVATVRAFLERHRALPIKAALLLQEGFPGIGNWMADEILWRAKVDPRRRAGKFPSPTLAALWTAIRFVSRGAMKHVSPAFSDPPKGWLCNERWKQGGVCPIHHSPLKRATVGGRTTAWCPRCQR